MQCPIHVSLQDKIFLQGVFLKRHKVPMSDGQPFTEGDIRVGENVNMYGRVFRIVDADAFTREYLADRGIHLGPKESTPIDPFTARLSANGYPSKAPKDGKPVLKSQVPFTDLHFLFRLDAPGTAVLSLLGTCLTCSHLQGCREKCK